MLRKAHQLEEKMREWRRDFHMHPEFGFKETRTSKRAAELLQGMGYTVRIGVGKTGIIAERGTGSPVVAIRADMDALPIQEANSVSYKSKVDGIMHACGHDVHTSIALGVAAILSDEIFKGRIRFLFQPAEEVADEEGVSGAPYMIAAGAMVGVDRVLALHVDPSTNAGDIALISGFASAGVDTFYATIFGKGGHGAMPHKVVDPIYITGHVILALHGIVSRRLYPFDPAVISIGSIHGGEIDNVIPDQVQLTGTIRYMEPNVQSLLHLEIERALSTSKSLGGDFHLKLEIGYPPMVNNPGVIEKIREAAIDLIGKDRVHNRKLEMGAEDFSYMSAITPGAMFSLGCASIPDEKKLHSPTFDVDESCLPIGAAILAETALRYLNQGIEG